jgi:hypothetical protein
MESIGPLMATASGTRSSRRCERLTPRAETGELFFLLAAHKLLQMLRVPGALHRILETALSMSLISLVVSSTAAAPMFSSRPQLGRARGRNNPSF